MTLKTEVDRERDELKYILRDKLPTLRSVLQIRQLEVSELLGLSLHHYRLIEFGNRKMTWNTFVTLFLYFYSNESSRSVIQSLGDFELRTITLLDVDTPIQRRKGVICQYCGFHNLEHAKFCGKCGTVIGRATKVCPGCSQAYRNGAHFCMACGTRL